MLNASPISGYGQKLTANGNRLEGIFSHIDKPLKNIVASVSDAIAMSHGLPDISKVDALKKNILADGMFTYYKLGRGKSIIISSKALSKEFSLLHEIGHLIDNQAVGTVGQFESERRDGKLSTIMKAVDDTESIQLLRQIQQAGKLEIHGKKRKIADDTRTQLDYLLQPEELWARAYSQFIVMKTDNIQLWNQLQTEQKEGFYFSKQWLPDDFKNVIFEIENFLIEQKWSLLPQP